MRNRLILLPGWGLGISPLEPLAAALHGLDEHLNVEIEPLPELDSSDLDDWLDELDSTVPQDAWLGGWSLGGMLAAELAARRGDRCCGLLTLASNPSFVAHEQWPSAMPGETFDAFLAGCRDDPRTTLKRFSLLCAQGAEDSRGLSRLLLGGAPHSSPAVLMSGLELLAQLDTRQALQAFRGPQLHLFAGLDGLVPAEAAGDLLALLPDVEIGLIEQAGHAFLLEDPHGVAGAIQAFCMRAAMTDLSLPNLSGGLPDKRQVAASFSRAAGTYDSVAELQRDVGSELLRRLPEDFSAGRWLDLGCGTGYFSRALGERFTGAQGVALDIAEGMLAHARPLGGATHFIAGDAECLPLQDASCDLIFSSLAVQWCADFASVLSEARRVLKPGGVFAFASLCVGTLFELRDSWRRVDGMVHVNRFRELGIYQHLCTDSGLRVASLQTRAHVLHYPDVRSLTHELKALGAHNINPGRPGGLTGRARILGLIEAYEQFRQAEGLPATYQVVYAVLEKPL